MSAFHPKRTLGNAQRSKANPGGRSGIALGGVGDDGVTATEEGDRELFLRGADFIFSISPSVSRAAFLLSAFMSSNALRCFSSSIDRHACVAIKSASPDFNPIEKAFSKLKAMLRKASELTVSGRWYLIGRLVDLFQPTECANYFSSCGYDPD